MRAANDRHDWTGAPSSPRELASAQESADFRPAETNVWGAEYPARRRRREGRGSHQGPRRDEGAAELLERAQSGHDEAGRRVLDHHHAAPRSGLALLHADRRRRGGQRSRLSRVLRRRQARECRRGSGAGIDLLLDSRRAPRRGARGLVFLEGDRNLASRAGLPPARATTSRRRPAIRCSTSSTAAARTRPGWIRQGRANFILDNLIAAGTCKADDRRDGVRVRAARRPGPPRPVRKAVRLAGNDEGHAGHGGGIRRTT